MKEIRDINTDIENVKEIGRISQNNREYDNNFYALFEVGRATLIEENLSEQRFFLLEKEDRSQLESQGIDEYLESCANEAVDNGDYYHYEVYAERLAWGVAEKADIETDDGYDGECNILSIGNYGGHSPITPVADEKTGESIEFENSDAAESWINAAKGEKYYLAHNEQARPEYVIIEA